MRHGVKSLRESWRRAECAPGRTQDERGPREGHGRRLIFCTRNRDEVGDLTDVSFDLSGTVSYKLPVPARVLIRLGIQNGPMYRALVDWKSRLIGNVNEYWNGFNRDRLVKLQDHEDFSALVTYATLPEATVIGYGNRDETYRECKLGRGKDRSRKPKRPRVSDTKQGFRPDFLVPPAWARAPRVELAFPDFPETDAVPRVKRTVAVRIDVSEEDKPRLLEDQFEVLLFVDSNSSPRPSGAICR